MIAKQMVNKAQFNYSKVRYSEEEMQVTHTLNHFPHQHSVNLKKLCPVGQTGFLSHCCFIADSFLRGTSSPNGCILSFYGRREAAKIK